MTRQHALVFIWANHIDTSGYLLGHLPSKASLLALLSLFLKVLPLYFLFLLGLFKALKFSPLIVLAILWLRYLLSTTVFTLSTPIYFTNIYLANIILL